MKKRISILQILAVGELPGPHFMLTECFNNEH